MDVGVQLTKQSSFEHLEHCLFFRSRIFFVEIPKKNRFCLWRQPEIISKRLLNHYSTNIRAHQNTKSFRLNQNVLDDFNRCRNKIKKFLGFFSTKQIVLGKRFTDVITNLSFERYLKYYYVFLVRMNYVVVGKDGFQNEKCLAF